MQSFWPKEIFSSPERGLIIETLNDQATALAELSGGSLEATVVTSSFDNVFSFKLMVAPAGRPNQAFELLVVRCNAGALPCVIEDFHTGRGRSPHLIDEPAFDAELSVRLSDRRTIEIVRLLRDEAVATRDPRSSPKGVVAWIAPHRFPSKYADGLLVQLKLGNLVGYIQANAVPALLEDPDQPNDSYKLLKDDQYLMYVTFAAPVALPVSRAEIDALRESAKAALIAWEAAEMAGVDRTDPPPADSVNETP